MKKTINIRKNEIMSASLVHKKAFEFFEKSLKINHDAGIESFLMKIPKYHNGFYVINMMLTELQSSKYIELYTITNKTYKPFSEKKELFLWDYHKHLEEYETVVSEEGVKQYLIPIKELVTVSTFIDETLDDNDDDFDLGTKEVSMKANNTKQATLFTKEPITNLEPKVIAKTMTDLRIIDMTARDLFSIIHAKPVSNKSWINELIINNK